MTRFFLECTIRAALIVGTAALLLYAMRVKAAPVKHRVWTGVLLLMLALPLWTAWGPKEPLRLLPASASAIADDAPLPASLPAYSAKETGDTWQRIATPSRPSVSGAGEILLGLYLFGAFIFLARLAIGTIKARWLVRESPVCAAGRGGVRCSAFCAAPVTVGCLRPAIILPENWRDWPERQLAAVLAHESEHVRRRDPLMQWVALFNRAIFWFHPAAWWLEREMSALAEECCDAAVLAQGHDPQDYAETLMHMARAVMQSGARIQATGTAMPGPRLPQRVRAIIEAAPIARISWVRAGLLIATCALVCAVFMAGVLAEPQSPAPAWEEAAGGKMSFSIASVKPDKAPQDINHTHSNVDLTPQPGFTPTGGLFSATNYPLTIYMWFAYKLTTEQVTALRDQLPKWALTTGYDVDARAAGNPTKDQYRLMMQSLLADRFKLAVHFEQRQSPVLALTLDKAGKLGPNLRKHDPGVPCTAATPAAGLTFSPATVAGGFPRACGQFMLLAPPTTGLRGGARDVSMQVIASLFSDNPVLGLSQPVVDKTGLTGTFDFVIDFAPQITGPLPPGVDYHPDPNAPTFLEALKDQLGLKLESGQTAPIDSPVIDHIEEPTPN